MESIKQLTPNYVSILVIQLAVYKNVCEQLKNIIGVLNGSIKNKMHDVFDH